jgi:sulfoxide reductase heme-binding subunit YedZ
VTDAAVSVGPHIFWITSRAAGTAALVLSSLGVGAGVLIGVRGRALKGMGGDIKALHEALSLATLVAIAVHGVTLLGDAYLHPSVFEISVPFTGSYRPFWTGLGVAAGWGLAALGLSYYARASIGAARWRSLHRFTALFWVLGIVHTLGAGTDAGQLWFLAVVFAPALPAAVLLLGRLSRRAADGSAAPEAPPRSYGNTVSPVASSTIEIATAGQASAASRISS